MDQRMLEKKTGNALKQLEEHGNQIAHLTATQQQVSMQLNSAGEILNAIIQAMGIQDTVQQIVLDNRQKAAAERSAAEKKALENMVAQKLLLAAPVISENSIIVGHETDKDGNTMLGRVQVALARIEEGFKPGLLAKGIGEEVKLPNGGSFFIDEIYEINPNPPAPAPVSADTTDAAAAPTTEAPPDSTALLSDSAALAAVASDAATTSPESVS